MGERERERERERGSGGFDRGSAVALHSEVWGSAGVGRNRAVFGPPGPGSPRGKRGLVGAASISLVLMSP